MTQFYIYIYTHTHFFLQYSFPLWFILWSSLVAQTVNNLPAMQETQVQLLGQEDLLKKEMAIHISGGPDGKEYACNAGDWEFDPRVRKIPWRRVWQPTPVFLPGESPGHRSLAGYSPWGCRESDITEQLIYLHTYILA